MWVYLVQTLMIPHLSTWVTKGFKGLVTCAKCNCDSYKSELGSLLEDEQKLGVGIFVGMIYYVIVYPYLLSFSSYNNVFFRIFTFLFTFVDNKLDQESIVKRIKRGPKKEETRHRVTGPADGHRTCAGHYPGAGNGQTPTARVLRGRVLFL